MALIKWTPRRDFLSLQEGMNELLEDAFGFPAKRRGFFERGFEPLVDVYEDKEKVEVKVELPGMDQKDVTVNVEDNVLTIKGEKKFEDEDKRDNYHKIERFYGKFERTFTLPSSIDQDKIKATFKKGVLRLELPKREEVKPKAIEIDVK
jgi:HSP20 family protein